MPVKKTAQIQVPEHQLDPYQRLISWIRERQDGAQIPLFIRDLWIEALLSGDFPQAHGYMVTNIEKDGSRGLKPGYCCLGVLGVAVCGLELEDGTLLASGGTKLTWNGKEASSYSYLNDEFASMLGLTEGTQRAFARANDDWMLGFPVIAKAIEEAL